MIPSFYDDDRKTLEEEFSIKPDGVAGGDLILRCQKDDGSFGIEKQCAPVAETNDHSGGSVGHWHAFMLGTAHELQEVKNGFRIALIYSLWLENDSLNPPVPVPRNPDLNRLSLSGHSIQQWVCNNGWKS